MLAEAEGRVHLPRTAITAGRMLSRVLLLWAALSAMLSSASACSGEYCGRVDKGSCGNACCKLEWRFPGRDAVDVMEALNASLHAGGPDGLYTYSPAALASLPPDPNPF
jgi:hypothetical protein